MKKSLHIKFLILAFLFLFIDNAFSQVQSPNPVLKFQATTSFDASGVVTAVLNWVADPTSNPSANSFYIYYSKTSSNNFSDFVKISEVTADANNSGYYTYTLTLQSNSYGCFAITAVAKTNGAIGESRAAFSCNNVDTKNYFYFGNYPPYLAKVNTEYTYYPKIFTNSNLPIKYEIVNSNNQKCTIDENTGAFKWTPTSQGAYQFVIKATLSDNSMSAEQKWTVTVSDPNAPYVKIQSTPAVYATPGKEYVYKILATSNLKCAINYEYIGELPKNASFDKSSGTFKWTPEPYQVISGAFKAILSCDEKIFAIQQFAIKGYDNSNSDLCATINGSVVLDNGAIPTDGKAIAWRISPDSKISPMYGTPIERGFFEMKVPEGEYVVEFYGSEFEHSWFDNATTFENAKRYALKCEESLSLKVALKSVKKANYYTVSGNVSSADNKAVWAYVEFLPVINTANSYNKTNLNFITKTDQNGNYSISLPDNYDYRAHAVAMEKTVYGDMYYNQVTSLLQADLIIANKDIKDINFVLPILETKNVGSFTGRVVDENNDGIQSAVFATSADGQNGKITQYATKTDEKGYFSFNNLPYGSYVILSIPIERTYLPGYYKMGDFVTTSWKEATRVSVGDFAPTVIYDIKHKTRTIVKGIIQVDGIVNKLLSVTKKGDQPQSEKSPMAGAFVYIVDSEGDISDFSFTDENGNFSLTQVAQGTVTVHVDAPGYEKASQIIHTDYQKNYKLSGYCFDLTPSIPLNVVESINNYKLYPNLTSGEVTIEMNSTNAIANLEVIDIMGNVVYNSTHNFANIGNNIIHLDLSGLTPGNYFLKICSAEQTSISTIKIVK